MHHRHFGREVRQEERFLHGRVAAADHQHVLSAVEKAVAGGAGRDAVALEFLLRRQLQPTRLRAGRDDEAVHVIAVARIAFEAERPMRKIDLAYMVGDNFRSDMLGLLLHLLHQPGTLDDVGETRIVLHVGRDRQLAAGLDAQDQGGVQHGARGINRGGVARRPRADDDNLGVGDLAHREKTLIALAGARSADWKPGFEQSALADCANLAADRALTRNAALSRRPAGTTGLKACAGWRAGPETVCRCHNLWVPGSYARYADQNATGL